MQRQRINGRTRSRAWAGLDAAESAVVSASAPQQPPRLPFARLPSPGPRPLLSDTIRGYTQCSGTAIVCSLSRLNRYPASTAQSSPRANSSKQFTSSSFLGHSHDLPSAST